MRDMEREDETMSVDRRSSDAVFGLLADETRVDILRALGETIDDPVTFSALYDRVAVEDSGNFNYHLDQLVGTFVRKADAGDGGGVGSGDGGGVGSGDGGGVGSGDGEAGDAGTPGYELTLAGRQIVGAMHAGTYTADATVDPIRLDWDCLLCGGGMVAKYEHERAQIVCRDCEKGARFSFPPGSIDQFERDELPAAFARRLRNLFQQPMSGFCQVCAGRTTSELASLPGGTEADPQPSEISFECQRCGTVAWLSGTSYATYHPVVEGFLRQHGFDTLAGHPSRIWAQLDLFESRIRSEDPPRLAVVFEHEGERVTTEILADATIAEVKHEEIAN